MWVGGKPQTRTRARLGARETGRAVVWRVGVGPGRGAGRGVVPNDARVGAWFPCLVLEKEEGEGRR